MSKLLCNISRNVTVLYIFIFKTWTNNIFFQKSPSMFLAVQGVYISLLTVLLYLQLRMHGLHNVSATLKFCNFEFYHRKRGQFWQQIVYTKFIYYITVKLRSVVYICSTVKKILNEKPYAWVLNKHTLTSSIHWTLNGCIKYTFYSITLSVWFIHSHGHKIYGGYVMFKRRWQSN